MEHKHRINKSSTESNTCLKDTRHSVHTTINVKQRVFPLNKVMGLCMVVIHPVSQDCPRLEPHVHHFNLPLVVCSDVSLGLSPGRIKVAKPPKTTRSDSGRGSVKYTSLFSVGV